MKKILIIVFGIIFIFMFNQDDYEINNDSIRFRVIANSNSVYDINMKEKVVSELSDILFINDNKDVIKKNILTNMSLFENRIDKLFDDNNYRQTYNIVYGLNEFPEKEYNGVLYKEGLYESLVVEIGEAKGDNYWCFLYPSLCLIDSNNNKNVKYKSKIVELFNSVF